MIKITTSSGSKLLKTKKNGQLSSKNVRTFFIHTKDKDNNPYVFINEDSRLEFMWDSADHIALLEQGTWVRIHAYGLRSHFLSWYPNITDVEQIPDPTGPS